MKRWQTDLLRVRRMSWTMLLATVALCTVGIFFIYSAGYIEGNPSSAGAGKHQRQIAFAGIGLLGFLGAAALDYRRLRKLSTWVYMGGIFLLLLVAVIGTVQYGARRWLTILPGVSVQPSELMKLGAIIMLARFLSQPGIDLSDVKTVGSALAIAGVPFVLIALQPDLSTAMVFVPLTLVMMFVAGVPIRILLILGLLGLLLMPFGWFLLGDYQQERILVFLDSDRDPLNAGWSKRQSEIAVGSGGMWGKGYLRGTQNILGFLPRSVAPTDFIYSVIAEELGFVGSAAVLLLFAIVIVSGMRTALLTHDMMGRLLAVGIITTVFGHLFVNIAMTVGLMPITGLPLPLLSYGGSFTVSTLIGLGILQSVHVRRPSRPQWGAMSYG
ncbi:MAG: rod shape-determining protein RodA [Verrucomicrobia bacterium]|nr:rod shape-determining protein RodA [Verrucomicrobiota bacterium]MDA1086714.1 rod shape-determining protein RodA [Verrucomicrobiota bacterium]